MPLLAISAKVEPEVKELFEKAFEQSDANTKNQFYEILLESFLNPKTKEVEVPRPTAEQQEEINRLITEIELLKNAKGDSENLLTELQTKITELETQKTELENRPPEGVKIGENQVLVTFDPDVAYVLDHEIQLAKKKTGKDYSRASMLIRVFWTSIRKGCAYPFKVWSDFELTQIRKKIESSSKIQD